MVRRSREMGYCVAWGCSSSSNKGSQSKCHFFRFPSAKTDLARRTMWTKRCQREKEWKPSVHSVLCSLHFELSAFERDPDKLKEYGYENARAKLKKDALPTKFVMKRFDENDLRAALRKDCEKRAKIEPSDSFVANVRLSAHPSNKTVLQQETDDMSSVMSDDFSSPGISHPVPMLVWEREEEEECQEMVEQVEEEEEIDVKPDIRELERSLYQHDQTAHDKGVSTEPDNLLAENTWLKMRVQKLEMELQRYKDTVSRIRADLDILNMV